MKKLMKKLEDIMVAITFAEAGEYDEANKLSGEAPYREGETAANPLRKTALETAGK